MMYKKQQRQLHDSTGETRAKLEDMRSAMRHLLTGVLDFPSAQFLTEFTLFAAHCPGATDKVSLEG